MEGLVSIFILTILLGAVTLMISTSLRITGLTTQMAETTQAAARDIALKAPDGSGGTLELTVSGGGISGDTVTVDVTILNNDTFTAFVPR